MGDLGETLTTIPLFSGLSREDIAKVLGKMEEERYEAGATIFRQGDKGDAFYLIQAGAVQVILEGGGRSETVAVLGPREWFGEMALLSGEPRSATILTLKETTVWKLSREAWDELIEKHPTWLRQFCATLSKRLSRIEQQYSQGRDAFNTLAEEFYGSRPAAEQAFLRRASLLATIDSKVVRFLLPGGSAEEFLSALEKSRLPLIRRVDGAYELHGFFRDFLSEKLLAVEGSQAKQLLHAQLGTVFESLHEWSRAIHHFLEAGEWAGATRLLIACHDELSRSSPAFAKKALERIPPEHFYSEPRLVHLKAEILAQLGDFAGAAQVYKQALAQRGAFGSEAVSRYREMAELLVQKKDYRQALSVLRSALSLAEQQSAEGAQSGVEPLGSVPPELPRAALFERRERRRSPLSLFAFREKSSLGRWAGGVLGFAVWAYLWFAKPDIGLDAAATKLFGLLCLTLLYWVFWVFPDYGVALLFALAVILTGLAKPEVVLGGFASTTWFMTLGVLGLGAAITSSGLFYRLSLQLVRFFPLNYSWQVVALGFMGIVVMALIPQQSARTAIISQMLLNLSESLGYKNPSKASTGLFVASFLGLGQLGFLFLTGSTTSLIAWGLLPAGVRAQFTWGYWFLAALPPTIVVAAIVIAGAVLLYRPEAQAHVSYRMVQNQLQVLGPLSRKEWITLAALCFTVTGWLTVSYHGIDGAWISLASLCVLVNTGALGWGMLKKGIDWELLVYMGATLGIPVLLTQAKIDQWLVGFLSPLILPFASSPVLTFVVILLVTYAVKLVFTSFLTVVTLTVALLPLAGELNVSPWVLAMVVLVASEVWFFPFQIDWHTLAYSTTEGKGFTYPLMARIQPVYAIAYVAALIAAIPYWRYLGLMP